MNYPIFKILLITIIVSVSGYSQNTLSIAPESNTELKKVAKLENEFVKISFVSSQRKGKKSIAPVFEIKTASGSCQSAGGMVPCPIIPLQCGYLPESMAALDGPHIGDITYPWVNVMPSEANLSI